MKTIQLTKMQGLGNDFVIIDYPEFVKTNLSMQDLAIKICDRNFGVGADGMIIPNTNPEDKTADIGWFFYNSDGTTAQMCGNGIRCFAKYAKDKNLVSSNKFRVETQAGIIVPEILENGEVRVNMSSPILDSEKIPFLTEVETKEFPNIKINHGFGSKIEIEGKSFELNPVSMGNPHCVIFVDDDSDLLNLAKTFGPVIEKHKFFPEKTNVEFIKIKSKNEMDLRVYERGCGITLACGTGACAAVVASILNNLTDSKVKVNLLAGALTIEWQGSWDDLSKDVFMSGPADYSFFAQYIL